MSPEPAPTTTEPAPTTTAPRRSDEDLTGEFWAAAAEGRLVRPVCHDCGRSSFTPRVVCPHCRSARWTYVDSDGLGVVTSHSTVHRGPDQSWDTPYVLGVVDLDEGWYMLTRLLVEPPDESDPGALIGTRVRVRFIDDDHHSASGTTKRRLPAFAPDTNASDALETSA